MERWWWCSGRLAFSFSPSSSQIPTKVHRRYLAYDWSTDGGNKQGRWRKKQEWRIYHTISDKLVLTPFSMSESLCLRLCFLTISARSKKPASPSDLAARKYNAVEVTLQVGWTPKMVPRYIASLAIGSWPLPPTTRTPIRIISTCLWLS